MPEFREELSFIGQHREIHHGLDKMKTLVITCRIGKTELRLDYMKTLMDDFGGVLWTHLDDEVKALGAEDMRKYWTLKEMARLYYWEDWRKINKSSQLIVVDWYKQRLSMSDKTL